jgi:TRAP-type C4-dicarboxylate transport system substrate-binding protein
MRILPSFAASAVVVAALVAMALWLVPSIPAQAQTVNLRYATQHPVEHTAQAAAEAIKAEVEEKTQGRVTITIYPANQLGDWTQVFDEVMMGTIDIAHTSVPESYDARIAAGFLPYLARDYVELAKVFAPDAYLPTVMGEILEKQGLKYFCHYCEGFSGIGLTKPAVDAAKPGVDKGVLCRVPGNDGFKLPTEYLGYRTSTIPYADVFAAIQTGVVDGWMGGPPNLNYLNYRDLIKYYYQYNVTHEATQIYMNMDKFKSLSEADQAVLEAAVRKQCAGSIDSAKADDDKYNKMMADMGINVVFFTPEELETMAQGVRENVWPKLAETYTKEFLDKLLESLK